MEKMDIKITAEIGDNLREICNKMLREIDTYTSAKETNEGLKVMAEIITNFIEKGIDYSKGYYKK